MANSVLNDSQSQIDEIIRNTAKNTASEVVPRVVSELTRFNDERTSNGYEVPELNDIKLGDFVKYQKMYNSLENQVMRRNSSVPQSLGEKLGQQIDQKLTDELVSRMLGNMFGGSSVLGQGAKSGGLIDNVTRIMNTSFMGEVGKGIGQNINDIIKVLGAERVGKIVDAYASQRPGAESQEEQQKRSEAALMSLDTSNPVHVNEFMKIAEVQSEDEAIRMILNEQEKILRKRGIGNRKIRDDDNNDKRVIQDRRDQRNDINRQLINQYDNPENQYVNDNQFVHTFNSNQNPGNDFFGSQNNVIPGMTNVSNQNPDELILSLSPDDPVSLHQYQIVKGISGVDQSVIKKMLIKEQDMLRKIMISTSVHPVVTNVPEESENIYGKLNSDINSNVANTDAEEVITKKEEQFSQGWKEEDLSVHVHKPELVVEPENLPKDQIRKESEISIIMDVLSKLNENSEKIVQKIEFLENEVNILKDNYMRQNNSEILSEPKDALYTDFVDNNDIVKDTTGDSNERIPDEVSTKNITHSQQDVRYNGENNVDIVGKKEEKLQEEKLDTDWWNERSNLLDINKGNSVGNEKEIDKGNDVDVKEIDKGDSDKKKFVIKK